MKCTLCLFCVASRGFSIKILKPVHIRHVFLKESLRVAEVNSISNCYELIIFWDVIKTTQEYSLKRSNVGDATESLTVVAGEHSSLTEHFSSLKLRYVGTVIFSHSIYYIFF